MNERRRERWSEATFLVAFAITLGIVVRMSLGFMVPLLLAVSAAVVLGPLNEWLVRALGGRRRPAALFMSLGTFVVFLVPLGIILVRLVQAALPLFERAGELVASGQLNAFVRGLLPESWRNGTSRVDLEAFSERLAQAAADVASALAGFAAALPGTAARALLDGVVTLIALYSFFAGGPRVLHLIVEATPMERHYTRDLMQTMAAAIRTVFVASLITAVVQMVLAYIAFRIVRVPYALGLAAIMAFFSFVFSLVPLLGSGLVWGPIGVVLLLTGRPLAGIFILLWGIVVLGLVDNVVKPLYAKSRLRLSPLVVFITLFGGIGLFGPIGALLGPLFAALAAAFLQIWTTDFLTDARPPPPAPPPSLGRLASRWPRLRRARREAG